MSKLIADLEAEGLVVKRMDKADRRAVRIAVTAQGKAIMHLGRKRRLELLRKRLATLSEADRAKLGEAAALMLRLAKDE
jgi:DNA-binding MarR family transcriptional regulator